MRPAAVRWFAALATLVIVSGAGATASLAQPRELLIGVLSWSEDPAYEPRRLEAAYPGAPLGRPVAGARVAAQESAFALEAAKLRVRIDAVEVDDETGARAALDAFVGRGAVAMLLDLPGPWIARLARAAGERHRGREPLLINVVAPEDVLRGAACHPSLFHVAPSRRMYADALAQFLAARRWTRVLVLQGPGEADRAIGEPFAAAARRLGLKIVHTRPFKLSNDPRERDLANVALLTGNADYDAVVVHDAEGEFARGVPGRTVLPRPVAGSAGLVALTWHPLQERYGAPQLNRRFVREHRRPMADADWGAWMAIKAIAQVAVAAPGGTVAQWRAALVDPRTGLDGFKGVRLSFRPWDRQLRQPLLLAAGDAIAATAPFEGFLHPTDTLDTLGADAPETACKPSP